MEEIPTMITLKCRKKHGRDPNHDDKDLEAKDESLILVEPEAEELTDHPPAQCKLFPNGKAPTQKASKSDKILNKNML